MQCASSIYSNFYLTGKCAFANTSDVSYNFNGPFNFNGTTKTRCGIDGGKNDTNNYHVQEN